MEEMETKVPNHEIDCEKDSNMCRCSELEERSKKAEARILELELEIDKRKFEYDTLEAEFKELHAQKNAIDNQLIACRTSSIDVREQGNSLKDENMGSREAGKEGNIVDLTEDGEEEEDMVDQLMVENHVLECEKRKAEREVEVWKEKFKDLELWVLQVDDSTILQGGKQLLREVIKGENRPNVKTVMEQLKVQEKSVDLVNLGPTCGIPGEGVDDLPAAGTPCEDHTCGHTPLVRKKGFYPKSEGDCNRVVIRRLSYAKERSPSKKIAPSTPSSDKAAGLNVINICDSDDESDTPHVQFSSPNNQETRKSSISTDHVVAGALDGKKDKTTENNLKTVACSQVYEEDMDDCTDNVPCVPTPKRKRATKIVTSDSENDEDDNIPISKLKKMHPQESINGTANSEGSLYDFPPSDDVDGIVSCSRRRRLSTLRQCEEKVKAEKVSSNKTSELKYGQEIHTTDDVEDGEYEEVGSESEDDSFIDDSSDVSNANNVFSQSEDESDGNVDLGKIFSRIRRSKDHKLKWELEADMLSAFANDLELCMKAVCALYRQQTSEEQISKEAMYQNNRGFSKFDAFRGSELAVFLTDGDPHGDLKKSVKELEDKGSSAVELCRNLASRYSKQLFAIYKNKEDPFFLPS